MNIFAPLFSFLLSYDYLRELLIITACRCLQHILVIRGHLLMMI